MNKIIIKKKAVYLVLTLLICLSLLIASFVISDINKEKNIEKAKVLTPFGCGYTELTVEEFTAQQKFSDKIFGGHFIRCE